MDLRGRIRFIYFDLDNTLWDFRRNTNIALRNVYDEKILKNKIKIDFNNFLDVYTNFNEELWRAFERGETTAEELKVTRFDKTIEELGIRNLVKAEELNNLYIENLVQLPNLMPNAKKILEYLTPNYSMGILSNGFEKGQYKKMNCSGILDYFNPIITSDGAGVSKPHPKIFNDAIEKSGFKTSEIAYVGDDYIVDTLAANKMGILGILLDPQNRINDNNIIKITNLIELKKYF
jgi:putative hydrolase of the HAD superfamily